MRFGLHVLIWLVFWSSAQQAYDRVERLVEDYLAPPEVQAQSEWDRNAGEKGLNCSSGIFDFGPDGPKCYSSI